MSDNKTPSHSKTARLLTIILICTLGGSMVLQYAVLGFLACSGRQEQIPVFEHLFNSSFPVVSKYVGYAVAFYLGISLLDYMRPIERLVEMLIPVILAWFGQRNS